MPFDLLLTKARLASNPQEVVDIGIAHGKIVAIAPQLAVADAGLIESAAGGLIVPGLVETHIHLDKSCIIERCSIVEGSLKEAIAETARVKRDFSEEDIFERASYLGTAIAAGTMHMRTHVEVDPRVGSKAFMPYANWHAVMRGRSTWRSAFSRRKVSSTTRAPKSCWSLPARRAPT
jgi:cytosine/creatinine deaminase